MSKQSDKVEVPPYLLRKETWSQGEVISMRNAMNVANKHDDASFVMVRK